MEDFTVSLADSTLADWVAVSIEAFIADWAAASDTDLPAASVIACGDQDGPLGVMGRDLSATPIPITPIPAATLPITRTPILAVTTSTPLMKCLFPILMEVIGNVRGVGTVMGVQVGRLEKGGGRAP